MPQSEPIPPLPARLSAGCSNARDGSEPPMPGPRPDEGWRPTTQKKKDKKEETHMLNRRQILRNAGGTALLLSGSYLAGWPLKALAGETATLPFDNGERPLVQYPQKRPLLRLTTRPPQLEPPFSVFDESVITPNDAFFVRYHLTLAPPPISTPIPTGSRSRAW
jgi:hypothetical protein